MADVFDRYSIGIDGTWSLEDLYRFPRAYEQVYFALEALVPTETDDSNTEERIARAFQAYPWRGGYSAVSFYNQLKWATPKFRRPRIASIQYASPGWIEMILNFDLAFKIGAIVTSVAGTIQLCNSTYNKIYSDLQRRKLLRIEVERKKVQLSSEENRLVIESAESMAKLLGLESAEALTKRTEDPLISLKILLSFYRRIRTLAEYQNRRKADFRKPEERIDEDELMF